jgi:hypothetical protein
VHLHAIEARLQLLKAAPDVFSLEVRRLEAGVRMRIEKLHELLDRDTEEARKIIGSLLDGPMKFEPVETEQGKRYEVTAQIATGDVLRVLSDPQRLRSQGDLPVAGTWNLRQILESAPAHVFEMRYLGWAHVAGGRRGRREDPSRGDSPLVSDGRFFLPY